MKEIDFIIISQSETVRYEEYSEMPLDRIDLYRDLVQLRMVYHDGGFRSHMDLLNKALYNKYFHEASYEERRHFFNIWNLAGLNGLLTISPLVNEGFYCKIINNFDAEFDILIEYCKNMTSPLIGISTTFILQWAEIGRIAKKIRKAVPNATLILGGAFVNDQFLNKGADKFERPMRKYGIKNIIYSFNSELDLLHLVKAINDESKKLSDINNLVYIDTDDSFKTTHEVWNPPVLDSPLAFRALFNKNRPVKTIQIRSGSGCPFRCAFCSYPVTAKGLHTANIESVRMWLDEIKQIGGVEAIVFTDDTLNVPLEKFRQIVKLLKEYPFRWYAFFRVQFTDEDLVKDMKESGCDGLYLGLESANDTILKNMNKKATVASYKHGIELLKKYDITLFAVFIIGFPGETEKTINDDIRFIEESGIGFYSVKEFFYLHTASIHDQREKFGLEGEGHTWKHNTMTSAQASEMKLKIFKNVRNSVFIDPDLGLWYLIYLRDRGLTWKQIRDFQVTVNEMVHQDNAGNYNNKTQLFNKLCDSIKGYIPLPSSEFDGTSH